MKKAFLIILFYLLLAACSTKHISIAPITNLVGNNVIVNVAGKNIDPTILNRLTREIKGQLIIAGFDIDKKTDRRINLNVLVTAFTPGNAALRVLVGFGAGRGSLLYTAEYTDQAGQTIAKMDGQERFTGAEVGFNQHYGGATTMGGEKTSTEVLIKEAAKHIVELALSKDEGDKPVAAEYSQPAVQIKSNKSPSEVLRELKQLHDDGVISDDEFETKKKEILQRM
jgi:hypothetical protein